MARALWWVLLFAIVLNVPARTAAPAENSGPAVRDEINALKTGKLVTLTLASGKKVTGSVMEKTADTVQLRVGRGFFRYRTEAYPVAEITSVKKRMPSWVGPVVVLGVVGGVVIGVAACVASGPCNN